MSGILKILTTLAAAFVAGSIGSLFVDNSVGSWYDMLWKPPLTPPPLMFTIVWIALYVVMAIAGAIVWSRKQSAHTETWVRFYFIQLLFNTGWIIFFFGYHSITVALFDLVVLLFMAMTLAISAWELDERVTYLMSAYAFWLLFVCYLNAGIWYLN